MTIFVDRTQIWDDGDYSVVGISLFNPDDRPNKVSGCHDGGSAPAAPAPVVFPGPTPQETALREEELETLRFQRSLLEQQIQQQNLLSPILFEEFGIEAIRDDSGFKQVKNPELEALRPELLDLRTGTRAPTSPSGIRLAELEEIFRTTPEFIDAPLEEGELGEITGFRQLPDPTGDLREEIELGLLERSKAALEGRLDVNPGLVRQLGESRDLLREGLRKQLGPGFETSTPGIEALAKFRQSESEILEGARRGDLTLAEQLSLGRSAEERAIGAFRTGGASGVVNRNLPITAALGGVTSGLAGVAGQFASDRALQSQVEIGNANRLATFNQNIFASQQATLGSLFSGIGSAVGGIGGAFIGAKFG